MFKVPGTVFVFTFEEYSKKAALVPHGAMYIVNVVLSELSQERRNSILDFRKCKGREQNAVGSIKAW